MSDHANSVDNNLQQTDDPKVWWRHVKAFLSIKSKHTIPPIFDVTNISLLTTDSEKASAFNHYFSQQCVPLDPNQELPDFCYITNSNLPDFCIHERDVLNELQSLQSNKATGPDGLGNIILKHIANSIPIIN